jgi:hypothetical protein
MWMVQHWALQSVFLLVQLMALQLVCNSVPTSVHRLVHVLLVQQMAPLLVYHLVKLMAYCLARVWLGHCLVHKFVQNWLVQMWLVQHSAPQLDPPLVQHLVHLLVELLLEWRWVHSLVLLMVPM